MEKIYVKNVKLIQLSQINDGNDGILSVAEESKEISFHIKRFFYIYNLKNSNAVRGKHAHRKVEQVLFCLNGSFEILLDDAENRQSIKLSEPNTGIYLGTYVWNVMRNFSDDCIILVIASDIYDENEYIRDYNQFMKEILLK